jgi:hypothetical protein
MGLFDFFSKKQSGDAKFVSEKSFRQNITMQSQSTPVLMGELRNIGVGSKTELKLEFFFYSDWPGKAAGLAAALQAINYDVEYGPAAGNKKLFVITGWTTKMKMTDDTVTRWSEQMCDLGYKFDFNFDGWGTTPDQ